MTLTVKIQIKPRSLPPPDIPGENLGSFAGRHLTGREARQEEEENVQGGGAGQVTVRPVCLGQSGEDLQDPGQPV